VSYRFLENVAFADIACEVKARSLDDLFSEAVCAFLAAQIDRPENLKARQKIDLDFEDSKRDLLLRRFLQELIYLKDTKRLLLKPAKIAVMRSRGRWILKARLAGETLNAARHHPVVDVKAVTLHRLGVRKTAFGWKATFVLDV
jgi:SHS2 domain-containing protein